MSKTAGALKSVDKCLISLLSLALLKKSKRTKVHVILILQFLFFYVGYYDDDDDDAEDENYGYDENYSALYRLAQQLGYV